MEKELTCMDCMISLQKKAQSKIIHALMELGDKNFIIPKYDGKTGVGTNTKKNDRRLFVWISVFVNDIEYLITLFFNEIDKESGNCHSQIGRIQFVKDITHSKYISSPNNVLKKGDDLKERPTVVEFCSYKWRDPLDFTDETCTKEQCLNKKWITVDDINLNEKMSIYIAEAFRNFIYKIEPI